MAGKCDCCPFNDGITEGATQGQNWGCLPTSGEMVQKFDSEGLALSCHENGETACRGLASVRNVKNATILKYEDWYHGNPTE